MEWRGEQLLAAVRRQLARNIAEGGEFLAEEMRKSIAEPYPPASSPGEPPHRRTGGLISRTTSQADGENLRAVAGAAGKVAYWLETGTNGRNGKGGMKARPFVRPALLNNLDRLKEITTAGIGRQTS